MPEVVPLMIGTAGHVDHGKTTLLERLVGDAPDADRLPEERTRGLTIDRRREKAWLSALNAARLALFLLNELDAADMERDPHEIADPRKGAALLDIHLLAWVQELIMRAPEPPAGGATA